MDPIATFDPPSLLPQLPSISPAAWHEKAVDKVYNFGRSIATLTKEALAAVQPYCRQFITKIQELWSELRPHLADFISFLKTPLGTACALLVSTVVLMKISQHAQGYLTSFIFMIGGIATSVLSGAYLLHAGFIPVNALILF